MKTASPLRYPGGKWRISPFVVKLLQLNKLFGCEYAEPYAGGASLALSLLLRGLVSKIHLNDLDIAVYSFWWSVLNRPEDLLRLIADTPLTIEEWRRQRSIYRNSPAEDHLGRGFAMFYLNRTNHSGIMNGGPIGGVTQQGKWRMDARFNRAELRRRVREVASRSDDIKVYHGDALSFLTCRAFTKNLFVYMDPPYFRPGRALYLNSYKDSDHSCVRTSAEQLSCHWMISYDDVPEIRKLYCGYPCRRNSLAYSARERYVGREVMFFSRSLRIPKITTLRPRNEGRCIG